MKRAMSRLMSSWRRRLVAGVAIAILSGGVSAWAIISSSGDLASVAAVEHPNGQSFTEISDGVLAGHHTQSVWTNLVLAGQNAAALPALSKWATRCSKQRSPAPRAAAE